MPRPCQRSPCSTLLCVHQADEGWSSVPRSSLSSACCVRPLCQLSFERITAVVGDTVTAMEKICINQKVPLHQQRDQHNLEWIWPQHENSSIIVVMVIVVHVYLRGAAFVCSFSLMAATSLNMTRCFWRTLSVWIHLPAVLLFEAEMWGRFETSVDLSCLSSSSCLIQLRITVLESMINQATDCDGVSGARGTGRAYNKKGCFITLLMRWGVKSRALALSLSFEGFM